MSDTVAIMPHCLGGYARKRVDYCERSPYQNRSRPHKIEKLKYGTKVCVQNWSRRSKLPSWSRRVFLRLGRPLLNKRPCAPDSPHHEPTNLYMILSSLHYFAQPISNESPADSVLFPERPRLHSRPFSVGNRLVCINWG
jgi:hypothetical protein